MRCPVVLLFPYNKPDHTDSIASGLESSLPTWSQRLNADR